MSRRDLSRNPRGKKPENRKKTEYEKQQTQEEVKQIKIELINFARTNWGKQWIESFLKTGRPFRMQRGIQYAEDDDRIENLTIHKGQIFATVQGTAPTPYRVKINLEIIPEEGWNNILSLLGSKYLNLILLLDGKLPDEIIEIFEQNNYPLFPSEIDATCSCPDQAVPCKHIASVVLYLARILDYDPFIILTLRGKDKNEILKGLKLAHSINIQGKQEPIIESTSKEEELKFNFKIPKITAKEIIYGDLNLTELNRIGFHFKKPGKIIETLENLGLPPNLENPKEFSNVLDGIYRTITLQVYKKAMDLETRK